MEQYVAREMPINRQRKTSKQINSTEYTSQKLYEQILTTKNMSKLGVLAHAFNSSTQKAQAGISASERNVSLVSAISSRTARSKY